VFPPGPHFNTKLSQMLSLLILNSTLDSISYDEGSHILFASFKWTGHDFDADMKAMRENEKVREWWRMTDGYQQSLAEGAVSSERGGVDGVPGWWKPLEEVFYFAG